jgi:hypothetical protein
MSPIAAAGNDRGDDVRAGSSRPGPAAARRLPLVQRHLGAPALVEYNARATV